MDEGGHPMATPERDLAPDAPKTHSRATTNGLPPGPATWPLLQMLRYARRPYQTLEEGAREFGNCFTGRAPGQPPIVMFSDPDASKNIFSADAYEMHAGEGQAPIVGPILGWKSLLVLDGSPSTRAPPPHAAVPRRANVALRAPHARDHRPRHRPLAARRRVSGPPRDASD